MVINKYIHTYTLSLSLYLSLFYLFSLIDFMSSGGYRTTCVIWGYTPPTQRAHLEVTNVTSILFFLIITVFPIFSQRIHDYN